MAAASIIIDLLMRTGSFETDTQRAGRALQKLNKQTKDSATAIAGEFKRVQDAIAKAGMTANQQKLFDLKQLGASQQQLKAYARNLDELDRKTKSLNASTAALGTTVKTAFAGVGVGVAFSAISSASDGYTKFTAQLKIATNGQREFAEAYENVQRISQAAQIDVVAAGSAYARFANATKDLGVSQQKIADVTETVTLALKTNGATASEASSVLLQLSQAFGATTLQGEEFRAIAEGAPPLLRALAKELGVTVGELKSLGKEGKLSIDVLIKAFSNPELLNSLREQAKEISTISGGYAEIGNQLKLIVGETNNATGATSLYAKTLSGIAFTLEKIRKGGGFDSGFLSLIPGGQAFSVFNQAGRARPQTSKSSSGTITRAPARTATPSQTFDELSKGLNLASIKMKDLVKTQEEAVRSLNTGKISYDQYKEIIAATGKEMQSLTEKNTKNTRSTRDNSSAITDFARQQQEVANILQKARDLNAPELSKFDQLQEELDAYTRLNPAVREYAENMILAAKAREQAAQWEEVMNDSLDREIEAYNEASEAQADFEKSIEDYVDSVKRAEDPTIELAQNIGKLWSAVSLGQMSPEEAERFTKFLEETSDKTKTTTDEITEFWREAARNMQDAMSDFFFDAMEGKLSDLAGNFTRTINRMVADIAAANFSKYLFGDDFGKGGDIGGVFGNIFGGFGDFFGGLLPSFDVGTPYVQRDMVAKIHKGERILTAQENRAFSAGKMSPQINMTVYANDAGSFMRSSGQIAKGLQRQLNQAQRVS
jgi:tape measure domain-containing protein